MQALQQRQALARQKGAERLRRHPVNMSEVRIRRAYVRELMGDYLTIDEMLSRVNAYMVKEKFPEITRRTLCADRARVIADYQEVFAEDALTRAQEHDFNLMNLQKMHMEDYKDTRKRKGNVASIVDNLRKIEVERGKFDGSLVEKHQNVNLTFEMKVQEALAVNPEGERKVIPLLKDEGYGELLPAPTKADG